jgi:hypothetical protein
VSDLFELSFRWQDGAVQVIIYALVIYLGLVIISKISDKRKRERDEIRRRNANAKRTSRVVQ